MKLILIFMLITGGWLSVAKQISDIAKRTSLEGELSLRYKLNVDETDAVQFMYKSKFVYSYSNIKWILGTSTNPRTRTSRYLSLMESKYPYGSLLGVDALHTEISFLSSQFKVRSGLMETPYYRGVSNSVLFDSDLRVPGVHVAYSSKRRSKHRLNIDASIFGGQNDQFKYIMTSLQAQCSKRLMRQAVAVGVGVHSIFGREEKKKSYFDFTNWFVDEEPLTSFGEAFAKVGLSNLPVTIYGSLLVNGVLKLNEGMFTSSDLSYFAGLEYKHSRKTSVSYTFADIKKSLAHTSHLMDSNIIADAINIHKADLKAHSVSVSYRNKVNQTLTGQFVAQDLSGSSEMVKIGFITLMLPF